MPIATRPSVKNTMVIHIRMTPELHAALRDRAERERRSLNTLLTLLLERAMQHEDD